MPQLLENCPHFPPRAGLVQGTNSHWLLRGRKALNILGRTLTWGTDELAERHESCKNVVTVVGTTVSNGWPAFLS